MSRWSRRGVLGGGMALGALACGGQPVAAEPPPPAGKSKSKSKASSAAWGPSERFLPEKSGLTKSWQFVESPAWFRALGGIYVPTAASAGSGMIQFANRVDGELQHRIDSFRELPKLLEEARALGTDLIYIVDWYAGNPDRKGPSWQNKGDYVPRPDLGGEAALRDGLAAVRAKGGRVMLYVEGFIASRTSDVGRKHGPAWSLKRADGTPEERPYADFWTMCPACEPWVAYIEGVAQRIAAYGASGVFMDSFGAQRGWKCHDPTHGHPPGDGDVFNRGMTTMADRVRKALRKRDPESVVLCEGPEVRMLFGALDGSFDWGIDRLMSRPVWDAVGWTDIFTTGWSIDDLHQILAAGSKLTLPATFLPAPAGTATAWLDDITRREPADVPGEVRLYADRAFRGVHHVRNAGIAAGAPVPPLDDVTPRRFQATDATESLAALRPLIARLRVRCGELDAALAGVQLGSPAPYVAKITGARVALSRVADDLARVTAIPQADPAAVAWKLEGRSGTAYTAVNLGNDEIAFDLPVRGAPELVEGGSTRVPGHRMRAWILG